MTTLPRPSDGAAPGDLATSVAHAAPVAVRTTSRTLPDPVDPARLLAALTDRPFPVLARHGGLTVVACDPERVATGPGAWDLLRVPCVPCDGHPMAGGVMGILCDSLAATLERLPDAGEDPSGLPSASLGRYPSVALVEDDGRCTLVSCDGATGIRHLERAAAAARDLRPDDAPTRSRPPRSSLPPARYREAVERARELIRAGDCYQVNLTQRLTAPWTAGGTALADRLWRAAGPAPLRGFVGLPAGAVVSASPELLLRLRGRSASSEPIKGTARPGAAELLALSPKDRAEHVMIVDLVRNDLGRIAVPGGVRVARLLDRLSTPYAEHLVSEVQALVTPQATPADVLRALFPAGSVTGTPKLRAIEVIRELEPVGRGPAFGSLVAMGRDGSTDASVTIRTAFVQDGRAHYWCGGAVVWDSDPEGEHDEAWTKAAPFLRAIGAA